MRANKLFCPCRLAAQDLRLAVGRRRFESCLGLFWAASSSGKTRLSHGRSGGFDSHAAYSRKANIRVKAQGGPLAWGASAGRFDPCHPDQGVAQSGRARASGARDWRFKSSHPDQWRTNPLGAGVAWNANGTRKVWVSSTPSSAQWKSYRIGSGPVSKAVRGRKSTGIETSLFRQPKLERPVYRAPTNAEMNIRCPRS